MLGLVLGIIAALLVLFIFSPPILQHPLTAASICEACTFLRPRDRRYVWPE